jgi:hypothetical protein
VLGGLLDRRALVQNYCAEFLDGKPWHMATPYATQRRATWLGSPPFCVASSKKPADRIIARGIGVVEARPRAWDETKPARVGYVSSDVAIVVYELVIADCGMVLKTGSAIGCRESGRAIGVPLPLATVGQSRPRRAALACADRSRAEDHVRFPS